MKFIILGCGSSMGVPRSDGYFGNCNPKNKKNYRTRCSALIKTKNEIALFDTSPDLRQQLINNNIKTVNKVFYSHMHADQTHGINDLRVFYIKKKKTISVYADKPTQKHLMNSFKYCFVNNSKEYPAILKLNSIKKNLFIKLKYLVIDCLWLRKHPSHLNLEESLELINEFKPKKAILTNLHSDLDYNYLKKKLPKNVVPAYDGLTINL